MRSNEYELCARAQEAVQYNLRDVAAKIARVIVADAWRQYVTPLGRVVAHSSFEAFVRAPRPDGLGTDVATLRKVCRDAPWARDLIDRATQRPPGRPADDETLDNVQGFPSGNSAEAALRRLRKHRPDLHERVLAGELSAHAAAVEAGFRSRRFSVSGDPEAAARILRRHLSDDEIGLLVTYLQKED